MRIVKLTKQFRRNYKKMRRSGKDLRKLDVVIRQLVRGQVLPSKYKDHCLQGQWQHLRDCHIEGDWILLYELGIDTKGKEMIIFHATDTHENLFG